MGWRTICRWCFWVFSSIAPGISCKQLIGCLRFTNLCWVGQHANIIMKPTNSPTQGQPHPRKIRLKVAFGPLFSHSKQFFVVLRLVLYRKQTTRHLTQPSNPQNTLYGIPSVLHNTNHCFVSTLLFVGLKGLHILAQVCFFGWGMELPPHVRKFLGKKY